MKRVISVWMLLTVLFASVCVTAFAEEEETTSPTNVPREPGWCGENVYWSYNRGTLTISGTGDMDDFPEGAPWQAHMDEIETVVLTGSVSYVGAHAFEDYDAITAVYLGDYLRELGMRAFYSCDGLTELALPSSFRVFGEECLRNCTFLKQIHCLGGMPSFRLNCLWDTWVDIFYPVNNPWPLEHIEQLESAFQGRIEFLAEDGYDPYIPPTEEAAMPSTEPESTTQPPTEPSTEPPTEIPTEAPTAPPAEAPTVPATTEPAAQPGPTEPPVIWGTQPPTEPAREEDSSLGSWIGGALIGMVVSAVAIGALVFGRRSGGGKGGGRYSR